MIRRVYEPPKITSMNEREVASSLGPVTLSATDVTVLQRSAVVDTAVHDSQHAGGQGAWGTSARVPNGTPRRGNR